MHYYVSFLVLQSFWREREGERERERDGCFTLIVFLMYCDYYSSVALPRGAVGWSAVCYIQSKPFIYLKAFATVHSPMKYTKLIDSCQAHMPVQYASKIEFIRHKWHWCCDWQRVTPETSFLFAPLPVRVHTGYSAFTFYTPTKPTVDAITYFTKLFCFLNYK